MADDVLSPRALNRATLARQFLLERVSMPTIDVIEHLVGLQAQEPSNPYVALWSRLIDFDPDELGQLLLDRKVVRTWVMRGTIHLVTAADALTLRPLTQPVLDGQLSRHPNAAPHLPGVDAEPVLAFARDLFAEAPRTGTELRAALAAQFPGVEPAALAELVRHKLALVQVPPRGLWRRSGIVRTTTVEAWLGKKLKARPSISDVVYRYIAAFGPATVADVAAWSRLTGLREVVERLRPSLRTFRDERGREVFDVPDAPRPDPETPAPVRFLPEYDNVLLSHADRTRVIPEAMRAVDFTPGGRVLGTVLSDGFLFGVWADAFDRKTGRATLTIRHGANLTKKARAALTTEGQQLLRFIHADAAAAEVVFTPATPSV
ncbi:MAG: winged helix DNA-binding domain-containing protein [Acidimicrobiia bacterium]